MSKPRRPVVDYGYGAMAGRRERLLAAASPALRARLLGSPPSYGAVRGAHWITVDIARRERIIERNVDATPGIAEILRREVRTLEQRRDGLRAEIAALRREQADTLVDDDDDDPLAIARIAKRFLGELAQLGYRIEGEAATLGHLTSRRSAAAWARPRKVAMWLCWSIARDAPLPAVGDFFCRHYTSVVHARRTVGAALAAVPALRTAARATCVRLGVEPPAALQA